MAKTYTIVQFFWVKSGLAQLDPLLWCSQKPGNQVVSLGCGLI